MKFQIGKEQLNSNYATFLKKLGYVFVRDRRSQSESFARRIRNDFYPRFHIYITENSDSVIFDIHIDHKKDASLSHSRHNTEYGGELVENEVSRIKSCVNANLPVKENVPPQKKRKKTLFRRIFNI